MKSLTKRVAGRLSRNLTADITKSVTAVGASGGSAESPLLDIYTGAAAAYSLRKLRTAYTGSAIRVRRSSDSAEQDIGFTSAGDLDESALTTFCGASDGFVTTRYDQSGNSEDEVQATAGSQPKIYDGTTGLVKYSGKTTVSNHIANSGIQLISPLTVASSDLSLFGVYGADETQAAGIVLSASGLALTFICVAENGSSSGTLAGEFTGSFFINSSLESGIGKTRDTVHSAMHIGSLVSFSTIGVTSANSSWGGGLRFGSYRNAGTFSALCHVPEWVVWKSNQSVNRVAIENNQKSYWGIT